MAGATSIGVDGWCHIVVDLFFSMCLWMAGATCTAVDGWCHNVDDLFLNCGWPMLLPVDALAVEAT